MAKRSRDFTVEVGLVTYRLPASVTSERALGGWELGRVDHDRVPKRTRSRDRWWQGWDMWFTLV